MWEVSYQREILDKSQEVLMKELFISRTDFSEQSASLFLGDRKIEQPMKSETKIEIDWENDLVRLWGQQNGQEVVMIKHGKRMAMKLDSAPWQVPDGAYETMAKDLGNLFVCERETPESRETLPNGESSEPNPSMGSKPSSLKVRGTLQWLSQRPE